MPIEITPVTRRGLAIISAAVLVPCALVAALTWWFDHRNDYQLDVLKAHPLARVRLTGAVETGRSDTDVSGTLLERRPAGVWRRWRPAGASPADLLRQLDAVARPDVTRAGARCLAVRDKSRGLAVFTWRLVPGTRDVELHGGYGNDQGSCMRSPAR